MNKQTESMNEPMNSNRTEQLLYYLLATCDWTTKWMKSNRTMATIIFASHLWLNKKHEWTEQTNNWINKLMKSITE